MISVSGSWNLCSPQGITQRLVWTSKWLMLHVGDSQVYLIYEWSVKIKIINCYYFLDYIRSALSININKRISANTGLPASCNLIPKNFMVHFLWRRYCTPWTGTPPIKYFCKYFSVTKTNQIRPVNVFVNKQEWF